MTGCHELATIKKLSAIPAPPVPTRGWQELSEECDLIKTRSPLQLMHTGNGREQI
jgi:hypothetical protein